MSPLAMVDELNRRDQEQIWLGEAGKGTVGRGEEAEGC